MKKVAGMLKMLPQMQINYSLIIIPPNIAAPNGRFLFTILYF